MVQLGQFLHLLCKRSTVVMFLSCTLINCIITGDLDIITGRPQFRYPQHKVSQRDHAVWVPWNSGRLFFVQHGQ